MKDYRESLKTQKRKSNLLSYYSSEIFWMKNKHTSNVCKQWPIMLDYVDMASKCPLSDDILFCWRYMS